MPKLDEYLRIGEAAAYLGVPKNTLRNWTLNGKVTAHTHPISGYRLFLVSDLDKLLKETEQSATRRAAKPR